MKETCNFCMKWEETATRINPNRGLMWLDNDQCWVCQECFKLEQAKRVITGVANK